MSKADLKARLAEIVSRLTREYPQARIALNFTNPLELLVATILSAQCTDEMVNKVTPPLFRKYPTVESLASANLLELQNAIRPTGFFRNKAKNIIAAAKLIRDQFYGQVPRTMEEILTLPGVARKTANIVLGNAYGVVEGIAVDTHVRRLSQRLRLTNNDNPDKIEHDLMRLLPREDWFKINYLLIDHGRGICHARNPLCPECVLMDICPSAGKVRRAAKRPRKGPVEHSAAKRR